MEIIKGADFLAEEQYEMRFPPKRLEDIEDNFDFLDEDDLIE